MCARRQGGVRAAAAARASERRIVPVFDLSTSESTYFVSSSVTVAVAWASSVVLARFRARGAVPASILVPPPSSPSAFARGKNDAIDLVDAIVVAPFARAETRTNGETDQ